MKKTRFSLSIENYNDGGSAEDTLWHNGFRAPRDGVNAPVDVKKSNGRVRVGDTLGQNWLRGPDGYTYMYIYIYLYIKSNINSVYMLYTRLHITANFGAHSCSLFPPEYDRQKFWSIGFDSVRIFCYTLWFVLYIQSMKAAIMAAFSQGPALPKQWFSEFFKVSSFVSVLDVSIFCESWPLL